jgi:hypothetical protein
LIGADRKSPAEGQGDAIDPKPISALAKCTAENAPLQRGITLLWCFLLNADQPGVTYLHGIKHSRCFRLFVGHVMRVVKVIVLLAVGVVFLLGFATFALRLLMQEGFWPGLAVMLICLGVILIGTVTAAFLIARAAKRRRGAPTFFELIGHAVLMAVCDPFGWFCVFLLLRRLSGHL